MGSQSSRLPFLAVQCRIYPNPVHIWLTIGTGPSLIPCKGLTHLQAHQVGMLIFYSFAMLGIKEFFTECPSSLLLGSWLWAWLELLNNSAVLLPCTVSYQWMLSCWSLLNVFKQWLEAVCWQPARGPPSKIWLLYSIKLLLTATSLQVQPVAPWPSLPHYRHMLAPFTTSGPTVSWSTMTYSGHWCLQYHLLECCNSSCWHLYDTRESTLEKLGIFVKFSWRFSKDPKNMCTSSSSSVMLYRHVGSLLTN